MGWAVCSVLVLRVSVLVNEGSQYQGDVAGCGPGHLHTVDLDGQVTQLHRGDGCKVWLQLRSSQEIGWKCQRENGKGDQEA
jgi:hypothetical protein